MRWFKSKKEENGVRLTDIYSNEELKEIKELLQRNRIGIKYRTIYHQTAVKEVLGYLGDPNKSYSLRKIKGFISPAKVVMELEPSIGPVLQKGVDRILLFEETGDVNVVREAVAASGEQASQQKDDLMKAIDQSGKSYEEIMQFINERK